MVFVIVRRIIILTARHVFRVKAFACMRTNRHPATGIMPIVRIPIKNRSAGDIMPNAAILFLKPYRRTMNARPL